MCSKNGALCGKRYEMQSNKNRKPRRKCSSIQKFKDNFLQPKNQSSLYPDGRPKESKDESDNSQIAILGIVFRVSDNRRRDIDGMVATVLDSCVSAGIFEDDDLGTIPAILTTWLPCPKGEEGFDLIIFEV